MEFPLFNKYLLSEYHAPSIFLGSRDFTRSRFPVFMEFILFYLMVLYTKILVFSFVENIV